jgi:hypothetical protein
VAVGLLASAAIPATAAAKNSRSFSGTERVGTLIPNAVTGGFDGVLRSEIDVPKRYKGKTVSLVKVTLRTIGGGPDSADDLSFELSAPNGRSVPLIGGLTGQSIGPLTLTPNTSTVICNATPPPFCDNPNASLYAPFVGTARATALALFTGVGMRGDWTLTVFDETGPVSTSILDFWKLTLSAQKPID